MERCAVLQACIRVLTVSDFPVFQNLCELVCPYGTLCSLIIQECFKRRMYVLV
uniref:Uncharacterized protein n=1 Tax=Anguilla anguilla TaxID=7936 RepID=A0A0E9X9Z7_ANGAN